jgi:hypothetical protein
MSRELSPAACGPAQGLVLLKTGAFSNKRPNLPVKVYGPDDLYLISNDYKYYRRVVVSARWVTTQLIAVTNFKICLYYYMNIYYQLKSVKPYLETVCMVKSLQIWHALSKLVNSITNGPVTVQLHALYFQRFSN